MSTVTSNTNESSVEVLTEAENSFIAMIRAAKEKNKGKPISLTEDTKLRKTCRVVGKVTVGSLVIGAVYLAVNAIFSGE